MRIGKYDSLYIPVYNTVNHKVFRYESFQASDMKFQGGTSGGGVR